VRFPTAEVRGAKAIESITHTAVNEALLENTFRRGKEEEEGKKVFTVMSPGYLTADASHPTLAESFPSSFVS
jgi:hypothetical protein